MSYNNRTNGVFDLKKESVIVANIVVDALMPAEIIDRDDADRASHVAATEFFKFKVIQNDSREEIDAKTESDNLAEIIISKLMSAGIIEQANNSRAVEIAAEEILVRRSMEYL